mmetsp:Transcript_20412/g.24531  ORF Transcript_20412/g.24531 Transcript_20412/m.24531 type:complete len:107 (+) Transcript_20412:164-484(+)
MSFNIPFCVHHPAIWKKKNAFALFRSVWLRFLRYKQSKMLYKSFPIANLTTVAATIILKKSLLDFMFRKENSSSNNWIIFNKSQFIRISGDVLSCGIKEPGSRGAQ